MGIGSLLVERGLISPQTLEEAIGLQRTSGERLERVLVRMGVVSREQVLALIGEQFHMPVVDLDTVTADPAVLAMIPAKLVYRQNCVPIHAGNGVLRVATSDPFELSMLEEFRLLTGCAIEVVLADEEELRKFIRENYGVGTDTLDAMSEEDDRGMGGRGRAGGRGGAGGRVGERVDADAEQAQEASVIKLVNDLLAEAIAERATDVHIEPYEHELAVRYRIDGVLERANVPPTIHRFGAAIISRLKIMANLNIAEKRRPQDGRITFRQKGREYDLRVSIIPMLFGEGVVLRVLHKSTVMLGLEQLGMPEGILERWTRLIDRPHGILLVTGPTGSGKSTTLYASLAQIVSDEVKAITVEDPVEYHVGKVNQIQVNPLVGLDFAAGLRAVLRHDPDVVMIGEIRDRETAETAVQASLTGHLVFSTLHTNDAPGATTRLLDMGVEPFLVASSVEAVLAQRLVRRICEECSTEVPAVAEDLPTDFSAERGLSLRKGKGCRNCRNTGFRGRIGIYELLRMDHDLREMVMRRENAPRIAAAALKAGLLDRLRDDGYAKARLGLTTVAEIVRALAG